MSQAQRRTERRKPRARVEDVVLLHRGENRESAIGTLFDISEGGIGVLIDGEMNEGDVVSITLALGTSKKVIHSKAVVRHVSGTRRGFEFVELTPAQIDLLREACRLAGV